MSRGGCTGLQSCIYAAQAWHIPVCLTAGLEHVCACSCCLQLCYSKFATALVKYSYFLYRLCYAGCEHVIQCSTQASYVSMVYHLVQPVDIPLAIKDEAWFLKHLKEVVNEHFDQTRAFYLFTER